MATIRVEIPFLLQNLARSGPEVMLEVSSPVTIDTVLDALEQRYPMLCGTVRDHITKKRRAFLRYFGCQQDLSFVDTTAPLPDAIVAGTEPFIIWGALSGG
jgi:molybdopterin synthase sulfur carrier subunit